MRLGFQKGHFPTQISSQVLNVPTRFNVVDAENAICSEGSGVILQKAPSAHSQNPTVYMLVLYRADIAFGQNAVLVCIFNAKHGCESDGRALAAWIACQFCTNYGVAEVKAGFIKFSLARFAIARSKLWIFNLQFGVEYAAKVPKHRGDKHDHRKHDNESKPFATWYPKRAGRHKSNKDCQGAKANKPNKAKQAHDHRKLPKYCAQNSAKALKRQSLHLTNHYSSSMVSVLRETEAGFRSPLDSRRSEPRPFWNAVFLMAGRIGRPKGLPTPRGRSANPMRPVTIFAGGGRRNTFSRRATMSEQRPDCAAIQRKLLINDIWAALTMFEQHAGRAHDLAEAVVTFSDKLDQTDPIQRCFIVMSHCVHESQQEAQQAFIHLANKINELREVS